MGRWRRTRGCTGSREGEVEVEVEGRWHVLDACSAVIILTGFISGLYVRMYMCVCACVSVWTDGLSSTVTAGAVGTNCTLRA